MRVDALIVTAVPIEREEALNALKERSISQCKSHLDAKGFQYWVGELRHCEGQDISVALAQADSMGGEYAAHIATALVRKLKPRFLGMCGLCAGWREKVFLGDLVIAAESYRHDRGKKLEAQDGSVLSDQFMPDPKSIPISTTRFGLDEFRRHWRYSLTTETPLTRPLSLEYQSRWLLTRLHDHNQNRGAHPQFHERRQDDCPDWTETRNYCNKRKWISDADLTLTSAGREEVDRLQTIAITDLPGDPAFQVHMDTMASGEVLSQDPQLFRELEKRGRKTIALEMEAHAIYMVASLEKVDTMVVKGVMDYSDGYKDDRFQRWGARLSAMFLLDWVTEVPLFSVSTSTDEILACPSLKQSGSTPPSVVMLTPELSPQPREVGSSRLSRPIPGQPFDRAYYLRRDREENAALNHFGDQHATILWGPERFGKTWLLESILGTVRASETDVVVATLNDALLDREEKEDALHFYLWCAKTLASQAGLDCGHIGHGWADRSGITQLESFLRDTLLPNLPGPLILVIDGAERWLSIPVAQDLFGAFRFWWQLRATSPWDRFYQLLTVSTRPESLRKSLTTSLFGVVPATQLSPLSLEQQAKLASVFGYVPQPGEIEKLETLVGGHPFLVAMAFHEAVREEQRLGPVLQNANLGLYRNHLARLRRQMDAAQVDYLDILRKLAAEPGIELPVSLYDELLRAGLIRAVSQPGMQGTASVLSCELYRDLLA